MTVIRVNFAPPAPPCPAGHHVRCARCGATVCVYGHIPERFIGGCCLVPVKANS